MTGIYGVCISDFPPSLVEPLLHFISNKERILKFHFIKDKIRSLVGELLLKKIINTLYNAPYEEMEITRDEYGKPFLSSPSIKVEFNISHAGDWVVVAIDRMKIGIDIEQIVTMNLEIAERFFTQEEYKYIAQQSSQEQRDEQFIRIWTMKESYIKGVGRGLTIPLDSFSTIINNQEATSIRVEEDVRHLKTFRHDTTYYISVCSTTPLDGKNIEIIDIHSLVNAFL
ncbi:4'-phosphopantetheinyl transferase family protein [Paenibacillus pini]|uniref:4'-phosphopantetheinyl transferase n=1 Tax=Paenibacillus pini JCM 16418 TaxID=1236976 RepID=W7YWZ0_9BACL|nr:4'-phosphopantetheinyl transferase superfamily protein [Paenibacillus pini]GAF06909.1 4'-phosphopantetheinyl transferase [Paenibacillus pini JCM 16418]